MKKIIAMTFASLTLICSLSQADVAKEKYEVVNIKGIDTVLIPIELAERMDHIIKSNLSESDKLATLKALVYKEGGLTKQGTSFCKVSGETYQKDGKDEVKMAQQCSDILQGDELIDTVYTEYKDVNDLRMKYSEFFMIAITFSM